ncbi:MAG: hypothetical protein KH031_28725 [Clostridiales bacterium]|nr:hypothetical protein [Clostridiales bacterium]
MHGNVNAYGQLIEMHKLYLYRTAYLYAKNEDAALDIVSECVVKAFSSIKTMKEPRYFKTWLTRILINASRDYFRSHKEQIPYDDLPLSAPEGSVKAYLSKGREELRKYLKEDYIYVQ